MSLFLRVFLLCLISATLTPLLHAAPPERDIALKPDDGISMEVYGEEELSKKIRILKSGDAVFPLIGNVHLAGLTLSEATRKVRDLYNRDYLVEPKVTLTVDDYAAEFITVAGAVNTPGPVSIPASGVLDLSMALASSGGLSPQADSDNITVTRAAGGVSTHSEAELRRAAPVPLRAGDKVLVNESRFIRKTLILQGRVVKPGQVGFPLDGKLDIVTAIAQAGGFHELANPRKVEVNRKGRIIRLNVREMSEKGNRRFFLEPDDIITVPERLF